MKTIASWTGCFLLGWLCSYLPPEANEDHAGNQSSPPSSLLPKAKSSWHGNLDTLCAWFGIEAKSREALTTSLADLDPSTRLAKFRDLAAWNPSLAADLARELLDHSGDIDCLAEVLKYWVVDNPGAAGRRLLGLPKAEGKVLTKALVDVVTKQNPWAMGALMQGGDADSWPKRVQEGATSEWSKHDPEGAAAWIASLDETATKRLAKRCLSDFIGYNEVGGGWEVYLKAFGHLDVLEEMDAQRLIGATASEQSWEEAASFMQSLGHPSAQKAYLASFLGSRLMVDVDETRRLFDEQVPSAMKEQIATLIGTRLASGGDDAWAWMRERTDSFDLDAQADFLFLEAFDPRDGRATRSKLTELIADLDSEAPIPKKLLRSVEAIGTVGAMYDLPETLAWSRELKNEEIRQQALIAMAGRSQANDPAMTSEIISEIAPGVRRNQLIKGLVTEIQDDPERAFQWASVVDAPELREQLARGVLNQFWEATPELLERAIHNSALTDAEKARLRADYITQGEAP